MPHRHFGHIDGAFADRRTARDATADETERGSRHSAAFFRTSASLFYPSDSPASTADGWRSNTVHRRSLKVVWLLTAITRGLVAVFVLVKVSSGSLEPGWNAVSMTDGAFAILQVAGLARGWLPDVRD